MIEELSTLRNKLLLDASQRRSNVTQKRNDISERLAVIRAEEAECREEETVIASLVHNAENLSETIALLEKS